MRKVLLFLVVSFLVSCGSDDEFEKSKATIIDSGNPALDGCGWLVRIGSTDYKPITNLPVEFQVDALEVIITYTILKSMGDCDIPNSIRQIDIKKIEERN